MNGHEWVKAEDGSKIGSQGARAQAGQLCSTLARFRTTGVAKQNVRDYSCAVAGDKSSQRSNGLCGS